MPKIKKIYPAYISKHKSIPEQQSLLLSIPNEEKHKRLEILATRATF